MEDKQQPKVIVLTNLTKQPLEKKPNSPQGETKDDWKNDIYGFECANWTCKC